MTDRTPADGPDAEERIEALSALLQTEDAGIQNASQVSMALVGIVIAYLPVSVFAVYQADFPTGLIGFLPWPVVFLMLYQTVMLAGTSRRARSARLIEDELIRIAGMRPLAERGLVGARARNPITNLYTIVQERGDRWVSRYVAALLPFLGLYGLGVIYTFFMCLEASRLNPDYPTRFWVVIVPILGSVLLWSLFADSAMSYFTPRYKINIWVPVAALVGIWLQAQQPDLRTPVLLLFSVLSALLVTLASFARPLQPPGYQVILRSGVAGIVLSSLFYWSVVVPTQGLRTDEDTFWANVSMHLITPVVMIAGLVVGPARLRPLSLRQVLAMMIFPIAYVCTLWFAHARFGVPIPYFFLDPDQTSAGVVAAVCVGVAGFYVAVGMFDRVFARRAPARRAEG
ncbi:MAG TPA: hypothetical protein VK020_01670 [Microlunatus sp.]|nr:hypothetical protein [Microlunatus sp.]